MHRPQELAQEPMPPPLSKRPRYTSPTPPHKKKPIPLAIHKKKPIKKHIKEEFSKHIEQDRGFVHMPPRKVHVKKEQLSSDNDGTSHRSGIRARSLIRWRIGDFSGRQSALLNALNLDAPAEATRNVKKEQWTVRPQWMEQRKKEWEEEEEMPSVDTIIDIIKGKYDRIIKGKYEYPGCDQCGRMTRRLHEDACRGCKFNKYCTRCI